MKCHCFSIADFLCPCDTSHSPYFCFAHMKPHIFHSELRLLPNMQTLSKMSSTALELLETKEKIRKLESDAREIAGKCIKKIQSSLKSALDDMEKSISYIEKSVEVINSSTINTPEAFLSLHRYLFTDQAYKLDDLVLFHSKHQGLLEKCENLFTIESKADSLLKTEIYSFTDLKFLEAEIKRQNQLTALKNLKNSNKPNAFIQKIYQMSKLRINRLKSGSLNCSIPSAPNLEAINIYSNSVYQLTHFSFQNCECDDEGFSKIFEILCNFKAITPEIAFINCIGSESQYELLGMALERYLSSIKLDLSLNCIGPTGMKILLAPMRKFYKLQVLNLDGTFLTSAGAVLLSEALLNLRSLISVNIRNNQFGVEGAIALKPGLLQLKNLEELFISQNEVKAEGIAAIMEAVHTLSHMCRLDICMNDIDDEGGIVLTEYLPYMLALSYLKIDFVLSNDVKGKICELSASTCKVICYSPENRLVIKRV